MSKKVFRRIDGAIRVALVGLILGMLVTGCTDAKLAQLGAIGDPGHITCYSGGKVIFDGRSTGKILNEDTSDGWYFNDASTNTLVRVSGDCVIRN